MEENFIPKYQNVKMKKCETWLTDPVENSERFPDSYTVFRYNRKHCKGGGVVVVIQRF